MRSRGELPAKVSCALSATLSNSARTQVSTFVTAGEAARRIKTEAPMTRSTSLARLKAAVRRDLESLLNTRRTPDFIPEGADRPTLS